MPSRDRPHPECPRGARRTACGEWRTAAVGIDANGDGTVEQTVSYTYDAGGLRTQLTLPDASTFTYAYNARGELVSMTDETGTTAFAHDHAGRLIAVERPNGLRSRYRYDVAGRLRDLRHSTNGRTLGHYQYEVDKRGNRTRAFEVLPHPATTGDLVILPGDAAIRTREPWATDAVNGGVKATSERARLRVPFFGAEAALLMGTGPDHGRFDLYLNGSLWQSFSGYTPVVGERTIALALTEEGPHTLEIRARSDQPTASTGVAVRFKRLTVTDSASAGTGVAATRGNRWHRRPAQRR